MNKTPVIVNKKARHEYEIIDTYEAGIALEGSEVKSIRAGRCTLVGAFCRFKNDQLMLVDCAIQPYENRSTHIDISNTRSRKLLLHKYELDKLKAKVEEKGFTLIPLKMYFKNHIVKVEIAVAKGKKLYDKREALKKADVDRDLERFRR